MSKPGKKVGTLSVKLERMKSRHQHASVEVELRLSVQSGTFHAEYEGAWYDAQTKDELSDKIRRAAAKTIDLAWTRYLVVDYEVRAWPLEGDSGRPQGQGCYETLSVDEDRATLARDPELEDEDVRRSEGRVITSLDLHWVVCEFSSPYPLPEDRARTVRMRREVRCEFAGRDEGGRPTYREVVGQPSEEDDDRLPPGAVPWTAEREALLREVLAALGRLDARMVELFRGDPDELARRLDAAARGSSVRLLAEPEVADDRAAAVDVVHGGGPPRRSAAAPRSRSRRGSS